MLDDGLEFITSYFNTLSVHRVFGSRSSLYGLKGPKPHMQCDFRLGNTAGSKCLYQPWGEV